MTEFKQFQEYIQKLRKIYFNALTAFYCHEAILEQLAPNIVGKDIAQKNADTINRFNSFFVTVKYSLWTSSMLDLAKMFDRRTSVSLKLLIQYSLLHKDKLTAIEFGQYNNDKGRVFLDELKKEYVGVNERDIETIEDKLEKLKPFVKSIKTLRDKYIAHEDRVKPEVFVTNSEIETVFSDVAEILDIFSSKSNHETFKYSHIEEMCKRDFQSLLGLLCAKV